MTPIEHKLESLPAKDLEDYSVASPATIAIRRLTLFHPEASSRGIKRLQAFIEVQEDGFLLVMENSVEHFPHGEQGWESATLAAIRDICELHGLDPDPSN
jgi:hypothetical protein